MKIAILFVNDLIFSAKLKEAASGSDYECRSVKSIEDLELALKSNPDLLVINLGMTKAEPFKALELALKTTTKTFCYYSHVDHELFEKAKSLGCSEVYPRSKITDRFKSSLSQHS